jgi:hypothetical protein
MSDTIDTVNETGDLMHEPERLLNDLRAMPRINAPIDFSVHLSRALEEQKERSTTLWWKRLFRAASEGGFGIPAYAYGAVAAVTVLVVSVYVYNATDFEQELQQEGVTPPIEEVERNVPVETDAIRNELVPPAKVSRHPEAHTSSDDNAPIEKMENDLAPAPAPAPVPASASAPASTPGRRDLKDARKRQMKSTATQEVKEGLEVSGESLAPTVRGFMDEEGPLMPLDTSDKADSLRRLDSLRQLNQDNMREPITDPR